LARPFVVPTQLFLEMTTSSCNGGSALTALALRDAASWQSATPWTLGASEAAWLLSQAASREAALASAMERRWQMACADAKNAEAASAYNAEMQRMQMEADAKSAKALQRWHCRDCRCKDCKMQRQIEGYDDGEMAVAADAKTAEANAAAANAANEGMTEEAKKRGNQVFLKVALNGGRGSDNWHGRRGVLHGAMANISGTDDFHLPWWLITHFTSVDDQWWLSVTCIDGCGWTDRYVMPSGSCSLGPSILRSCESSQL